jgi:hypothetical protein
MNLNFLSAKYWVPPLLFLGVSAIMVYSYPLNANHISNKLLPNKLVIVRPQDMYDHLPAFAMTITQASVVEKLYADIYSAASRIPRGNYNCPNENFDKYILNFYHGNRPVLYAEYNPTGCKIIHLDSGENRWAEGGFFDPDLREALGLSTSDY